MFLKYLLVWLITFVAVSVLDALWHLVLFKNLYLEGLRPVARMQDGQLAMKGLPGLLSQVLVITAYMVLVLYKAPDDMNALDAAIVGAAGGALAISVYGLVNYALVDGWGSTITILEVIWGPLIGAISGLIIVWLRGLLL